MGWYAWGHGKPIVLTILDGWGYRAETHGNAIAQARKPTYDRLLREYPNTLLRASEHFVGLPDGQMGNSEVGHLNLGAGRIVRMDMTRIDTAIADGSLYTRPYAALRRYDQAARSRERSLHLIGLLSDGGVHSHQRHLYALLRMCAKERGIERRCSYMRFWMGATRCRTRDWATWSELFQQVAARWAWGQLASVCQGRYFAMDRDLRWEKEKQAFDAMVTGHRGWRRCMRMRRPGCRSSTRTGITDEFMCRPVRVWMLRARR